MRDDDGYAPTAQMLICLIFPACVQKNTDSDDRCHTFRWVPPGKYRIFIVDSQFRSDVAACAPRFADFLKDQATPVEVREEGETEATGRYVDGETVKLALRQGGSID